jgi:hypothetical protein
MNVTKPWACFAAMLGAALLFSTTGWAHRPVPPHAFTRIGPRLAPYVAPHASISGSWTQLANVPPDYVDTGLLLTDGTVIMHAGACSGRWLRLTPDSTGSYVNGTWKKIATMPSGYAPFYFASQVLPSGQVIVNGGEYNGAKSCGRDKPNWTNKGALYDPVSNKWTSVAVPSDWTDVGDAQSVVLANGLYMLTDCCDYKEATAVISGKTVTWTPVTNGFYPNEEGWTLLPDNSLLTVDVWTSGKKKYNDFELFSPTTNTWKLGGETANLLSDPELREIGAAVLRPNGTVFQAGANSCNNPATCPAHTGIYDFATKKWSKGPSFPQIAGSYYDEADGPASLLPDGNVLVEANPGQSGTPTNFFEFDGKNLVRVSEPMNAPNTVAYANRMLVLPTGQILWTDGGYDVEVYNEKGKPNAKSIPVIKTSPKKVKRGNVNYKISGTLFNGLSQGASYGDDAQMATNYPLVRITNTTTGRVCYARTHDFPMGLSISATAVTTAMFDVPSATPPAGTQPCDAGTSQIQVIVNGIASAAVPINVH